MSTAIVSGKKGGDIDIIVNSEGYVIIIIKTAQARGIDVSYERLETVNEVIQRPQLFFNENKSLRYVLKKRPLDTRGL
jgi:hypothetical protein